VLQENLIVSGGTCSLDASTNDTHVVQIVKHPGKYLCSQLILGANGLGKAIVTIQDVGLSPRATTHSLVHFFGTFFSILLILFVLEVNQCLYW
jgi:nuclear pore complex protein Nup210